MISTIKQLISFRAFCGRPTVLCFAAAAIFAAGLSAYGQTTTSTNDGDRYTSTGSVELGARWVEVDGNENKFRSDLNYKNGFRLFDSSIVIDDNAKGEFKLFDSMMLLASGWGADPSGYIRANVERDGIYKFDANVRKVIYFNNLNNNAVGNDLRSLHTADRQRNFGDFDLTLLPGNPNFRFRAGFGFNEAHGDGVSSTRVSRGDVFPIYADVNTKAYDFRVGADANLLGFNLSGTYGFRTYSENTNFSLTNDPGDVPTNANVIQQMNRTNPVDGSTNFGIFSIQRTFAERLDFTGRIVYTTTNNDWYFLENVRYVSPTSPNPVVNDNYDVTGDAKRVQTRGDLGLTWRITDRIRVSNTFNYDRFNISSDNLYNQVVTPGSTTRRNDYASTYYRRYTNTLEGDFQVNNRFAFNLGWRYSKREVAIDLLQWNVGTAMPLVSPEEAENSTNSFIAGTLIKPLKNWSIWADIEAGKADNVFTRLGNYEFVNFRIRNRATFDKFAFNVSYISKDNDNPGQSVAAPSANFVTQVQSRIFTSSIDWDPIKEVRLSAGYDYHWLTSEVSVLIPLGGPATVGLSQYFIRDNYFFVDGYFRPHKRVSIFGSYRWNKDDGHGNRAIPPLNSSLILSSYPIDFKTPEVRAAFRLNRYLDWNIGYQYYSYDEENPQSVQYNIPPQNYNAHLPYMSLRLYFGRAKSDR